MPLMSIKQVQGGEELQGNVKALLDIIGKDKDAFFNEMLNWLLSEAPQDFNPQIFRNSKLVKLVSSAITANNESDVPTKTPYLSFIEENNEPFTLKSELFYDRDENGEFIGEEKTIWDGIMEYSVDTSTWTVWDGTEINSSNDGKLYVRGTNNSIVHNDAVHLGFILSEDKRIQCLGNIENLLDYATVATGNHPVMGDNCFENLFAANDSLVSAPELPATVLTKACYQSMFQECFSLAQAPDLPATTLATGCYCRMFENCASLVTAPELPATVLAPDCYKRMFCYCTALTTAPELPATTLADSCYSSMFENTALVVAPALPASILKANCYAGMFSYCESLTTAPQFPATTLASNCYYRMFRESSSLTGTIHCAASTASDPERLDAKANISPDATATVVYDL